MRYDAPDMFGAFLEGVRRVVSAPALFVVATVATYLLTWPDPLHVLPVADDPWGVRTIAERAAWHAPALTVLWLFLTGGILDRYARARPIRTAAFAAAGGEFLVRFLRLAVVLGPVYYVVLDWGASRLPDTPGSRVGLVALLGLLTLLTDYAQIRAVVEGRRSMLGAAAAGLRFIRRHPGPVLLLHLLASLPAVGAAWWNVTGIPVAGPALYTFVLVGSGLLRLAVHTAYFQSRLAHVGWTALPPFVWPESPAEEAIANLRTVNRP